MTKEATAARPVTRRAHLITFLGALLACVIAVLWMIGPYLLSLFLGATLAMLTYPVYQWFRAKKWGPRLAGSAVTALLLLLVIAPLTGFSILAVKQGITIGQRMTELKEFSPKAITVTLSRWQLVRTLIGDPKQVNAQLKGAIQAAGEFTTAGVLELGKGMPELLLQLILAMIAFFFFLLDGEELVGWTFGLGVFDPTVQKNLAASFRDTTISSVLAGLAAAAAQAALIVVGFLVIGVPGAFLAGGLTFIFAWIPMLGTAPASLAGLIYLYTMQGTPLQIALMIFITLAASVIDNLVRPLVLKGRNDMHPLTGLIAIIGGLQLFGIQGVLIGPILAAMLLSLLKFWPVIRGGLGIGAAAALAPGKEP
ncbi:MAG TPA: hypothetical protein DCZ92_01490 [Elusimicrobia bacterium]|nr:MAG: hypothetical protein A2016_12425 [Elusimicrobia bacterium GWF2_62_30]HBA59499.1 hypothetical protein [Elusimicrobiota bacterium]